MLRSKAHVHRNKKGNVVKVVNEHYLRDDIWCSSQICQICTHTTAGSSSSTTSMGPVLSAAPDTTQRYPMPHYCLPDTNVFINQVLLLTILASSI
jgi:exosome complex exonuclease DIS3/RRP44